MSYRTAILEKLPRTASVTFLSSKFVCMSFLILHARIQFLKESRVVAIESFSIELKETIAHKCSKKQVFSEYWKIHFISFRAWVENLHIKNCINYLLVKMPTYFYSTLTIRLEILL